MEVSQTCRADLIVYVVSCDRYVWYVVGLSVHRRADDVVGLQGRASAMPVGCFARFDARPSSESCACLGSTAGRSRCISVLTSQVPLAADICRARSGRTWSWAAGVWSLTRVVDI
eukprot:9428889-Pyramimonas_sp.AAC.1